MKAMVLKEQGGVENFYLEELPLPSVNKNEILIRSRAIGINPADAIVRANKRLDSLFLNEKYKILGWDISGIIVAKGSEVNEFNIGDEIFGTIHHPDSSGKAYAEYVAAPKDQITIKPANITHQQAVASTLAALTILQPFRKVGIKSGDKVLITAAGDGVGHFAVQLAKYFGAYVIAVASENKKEFVMGLGVDQFIDYRKERFEDIVQNIDIVVDAVRSDQHISRSLKVIKPGGKLISLWSHITTENAMKAQEKQINAFYNAVRSSGNDMRFIAELLETGKLRPYISKEYTFEEIPLAHKEIEKNSTKGKIIISL
ncbi:NADP-dependent oxidoreductase [Dysgonomonas gadei]|uniref:Enoyl reductase (ER) domain-containing protein n=1 Tax=Dysgonomonas gadei ATCC BAA-286 TaxID=742766 RepID=F5J290_9BACT|nr:NADP-dependent oxidoreductase [Dysgonomonas gadei]EGK00210.1 hypothetical protein HMPREF9455_03349 [Dysgonomonas gadei ATCC BAA-286]